MEWFLVQNSGSIKYHISLKQAPNTDIFLEEGYMNVQDVFFNQDFVWDAGCVLSLQSSLDSNVSNKSFILRHWSILTFV